MNFMKRTKEMSIKKHKQIEKIGRKMIKKDRKKILL